MAIRSRLGWLVALSLALSVGCGDDDDRTDDGDVVEDTAMYLTNGECGASRYCRMAYCGATLGQCADLPTNCESTENVVCGCDHVNYWNDCLREQSGVGASTPGECTAAATCGGLAGLECPTDQAVCTYLHETQAHCAIMDPGGVCWVVPETCPAVVIGGTLRSCASPTTGPCLDRCRAINEGGSFFDDSTCPV